MEIAYGPFERAVPLPATVVPEAGAATCRDGLLEIVLPKATGAPAAAVRVEIHL
jgi:HSP20 family protein